MTFETATSHAELRALAAQLRGKQLTAALTAIGCTWGLSDPVATKRQRLVDYYGRNLNSLAIERMARA